jgi:hypothetical protein
MLWYVFERGRDCMTFQALMLAALEMLTLAFMLTFGIEHCSTFLWILIA